MNFTRFHTWTRQLFCREIFWRDVAVGEWLLKRLKTKKWLFSSGSRPVTLCFGFDHWLEPVGEERYHIMFVAVRTRERERGGFRWRGNKRACCEQFGRRSAVIFGGNSSVSNSLFTTLTNMRHLGCVCLGGGRGGRMERMRGRCNLCVWLGGEEGGGRGVEGDHIPPGPQICILPLMEGCNLSFLFYWQKVYFAL